MKKLIALFLLISMISYGTNQEISKKKRKNQTEKTTRKKKAKKNRHSKKHTRKKTAPTEKKVVQKDTVIKEILLATVPEVVKDTLPEYLGELCPFKTEAHASYYADKFHGKKTASGALFDMHKYTAAHKKLPFGTMLKITNEANGKSVVVEVTDRGPFVKSREIDLSKKAFMDIVNNKNAGIMKVTIEVYTK